MHLLKIRPKLRPLFLFLDLMTEMMDMSSDLVGSGIPFLDYRTYAERIFFPGHQESPLRRDLDVPESRRQTVEQGLIQLSNLLNSKLFLTKVSRHSCFLLNLYLFIYLHLLSKPLCNSPTSLCLTSSILYILIHGWFYFAATTLHCQPCMYVCIRRTGRSHTRAILPRFTGLDRNKGDFSHTD